MAKGQTTPHGVNRASNPVRHVGSFASEILGSPLWDHQIKAAESDRFITTIAAARRTGKTTLAEVMAMHTAFVNRDCRVLIMSATQEAARRLTESIGSQLDRNRLTRGAVVDGFSTRIRLTNGSEIVSLPASQRQVRGFGKGVLLVILDEAGFMPAEMWAAAHYTALDERANGSRILLCGTPWGASDHFFRTSFEAGLDGDQDHATHHWTYEVSPIIDRAYLERRRDRMSPVEYAAEVLGEWSDASGALFARDLLDKQTASFEVAPLDTLAPPARCIIGVDWGVSFDLSAAVLIYRLPVDHLNPGTAERPVFIALPYTWPQKTYLRQVVADIATAGPEYRYIAPETNGVGAMPSQELHAQLRKVPTGCGRVWNAVATTNRTKTAGYGAILGLLEQGQLVLARDPNLLRQLAGLRFEQGERGFTRIEANESATHDDVADALMLAALPKAQARAGRVVSYLQLFANGARCPAEAHVPELDEPVVETGAGLRLYRRPPLQSVDAGHLTLPSDIREVPTADPSGSRARALQGRVAAVLNKPDPQEDQ